jgi:hypothetical protein
MKNIYFVFVLLFLGSLPQIFAQEKSPSQQFWETLSSHCGKAYEGKLISPESDPRFAGKLVMHVRSCEDGRLRIPFFVGEDRSRTWVLTRDVQQLIQLKHDHRHADGAEDAVTQYVARLRIQAQPARNFSQQTPSLRACFLQQWAMCGGLRWTKLPLPTT